MAPPNDKYVDTSGNAANQGDRADIKQATKEALSLVQDIIPALEQHLKKPDPYMDRLLDTYFHTTAKQDVQSILDTFREIEKELKDTTTYVVDKSESFHGKTTQIAKNKSTLGRDFFKDTAKERSGTIIHEAMHRMSAPGSTAKFRYWARIKFLGTGEWYVHQLFETEKTWKSHSTKTLMQYVDVYASFAQAYGDRQYLGRWGGLPEDVQRAQQVGPYKDFEKLIREFQERLKALGLYQGPIDGKSSPEFRKAMQRFFRENGLGIYNEQNLDQDYERQRILQKMKQVQQKK